MLFVVDWHKWRSNKLLLWQQVRIILRQLYVLLNCKDVPQDNDLNPKVIDHICLTSQLKLPKHSLTYKQHLLQLSQEWIELSDNLSATLGIFSFSLKNHELKLAFFLICISLVFLLYLLHQINSQKLFAIFGIKGDTIQIMKLCFSFQRLLQTCFYYLFGQMLHLRERATIDYFYSIFTFDFCYFIIVKQMSYGWLAQSALIPKKSKAIKVEDESSLFGLKTILMKEKEKISSSVQQKPKITNKMSTSRNKGIQQRMRRDELLQSEDRKVHEAQKTLKKKSEIYSELQKSKKNVGKLLVDFSEKSLLNNEDADFEKNRQLFYSKKLQELKKQRDEVQTQNFGEQDARERLAWQKKVLDELKGDFQQKEKVKQVFDRKLQKQEKDALRQIRKELNAEQRLIQQAKKRRQQIKAQRAYKLNKLNNINRIQDKKQTQVLQIKLSQQVQETKKEQ